MTPLALLFRCWNSLWTKPAIYKWEGAEASRMVPAVTDDAELGGGECFAFSKFVTGVCAINQEVSDLGPDFCVLEKSPFRIDVKFRVQTVSRGFDVKAFNPHGVDEAGEGKLTGFLLSRGGFVDYGLEELFGGIVIPYFLDS